MGNKAVRVLVVEDSMLFREMLVQAFEKEAGIEIVGTAADPFEARDRIIELRPDVMTLDVQMPRMNGIDFLKRLMPQYPMPVVVVSAVSDIVFDALGAGAVDFVAKPDGRNPSGMDSFFKELAVKVKIASIANVSHWKHKSSEAGNTAGIGRREESRIVAIGASTGGTEALYRIVRDLPTDIPGTVIVQHMPPVFTRMYAERLNKSCAVEVLEAEDGARLRPGCVLIAPGDIHIRIVKQDGGYVVRHDHTDKVNGHRPSVDVLFDSVATAAGNQAIGVILTGMGGDGANGLLKMRQKGARTIGQDESSCIVYGMPKVAWDLGAVEFQLGLTEVASKLVTLLK